MSHQSIGYHTRLHGNNTVKVCGGSFGGSFDAETANRLVKYHFTVVAKPSGSLVFVDREGREVSLYVTVDPGNTDAGKLARREYDEARRLVQVAEDKKRERLEDLLGNLTVDEAISRLEVHRG